MRYGFRKVKELFSRERQNCNSAKTVLRVKMEMTKQINCCPCGNQEIARSGSSAATILFSPDCGRFVETKTLRQAVLHWN
jgi:predicted RNA-binding Zn-ribbon protein involved in translation (DUF1610 family)